MFDRNNPTGRRLIIAKAVSAIVALGCSAIAIQAVVFRTRGLEVTFAAISLLGVPLGAWCILYIVRSVNRHHDRKRRKLPRDPLDDPFSTI